jgi:hypothetical protein
MEHATIQFVADKHYGTHHNNSSVNKPTFQQPHKLKAHKLRCRRSLLSVLFKNRQKLTVNVRSITAQEKHKIFHDYISNELKIVT